MNIQDVYMTKNYGVSVPTDSHYVLPSDKIIRVARLGYLLVILIFVLLLQTSQSTFINLDLLLPIYALLTVSFFINSVYLVFAEKLSSIPQWDGLMFGIDAIFIAIMNYLASGNYTVFLILFLLNIILCGLKYKAFGALILAMWTSVLFSLFLIFGPQVEGSPLYVGLLLNNFSFFSVAYLGGFLSHHFDSLNFEVASKSRDVESLQKLNELIVSNIASGLLYVDSNMRINWSNLNAERILETSLEGKLLKEVFFHDYYKFQPLVGEVIKGVSKRFELKVGTVKSQKILELQISRVRGDRAQISAQYDFVILIQDLTQIKSLEQKLRQQEKLAAVGQLAAGIAHEIRNPLASISGSIQLMSDSNEELTLENKKLMNITLKEIDRLNGLISEFLEYVKPEILTDEIVDISQVLKEVLSVVALDKSLNKNIKQDVSFNSQKSIQGNRDKLKQAFLNIIINAYQAMPDLDFGSVKVRTWDKSDSVIVTIEDQGIGILPDNIERIFEPFHTTKTKGTGLGLAISHKILESHGAAIQVESVLNKGTVFTIEFSCSSNPIGEEMKIKKEA